MDDSIKEIRNYIGGTFKFRVEPREYISVLVGGYIITPEGEFILVKDNENHSDIFTDYIYKYLGEENLHVINEILEIPSDIERSSSLDVLECSKILLSLGNIIYFGLKPEDAISACKQGGNVGYCIITLPDNYKEIITPLQREAILDLMATNRSIFGNYEKVSLHVYKFSDEDEMDIVEFTETLKSDKSLKISF